MKKNRMNWTPKIDKKPLFYGPPCINKGRSQFNDVEFHIAVKFHFHGPFHRMRLSVDMAMLNHGIELFTHILKVIFNGGAIEKILVEVD
jgi:hypothetical protein